MNEKNYSGIKHMLQILKDQVIKTKHGDLTDFGEGCIFFLNDMIENAEVLYKEELKRHQSNPIDPDYAEFKAWKMNKPTAPASLMEKINKYLAINVPSGPATSEDIYEQGRNDGESAVGRDIALIVSRYVSLAPKPEAKTEEGWAKIKCPKYADCHCGPGKEPYDGDCPTNALIAECVVVVRHPATLKEKE